MVYEIEWFATMSLAIYGILETLKHSGLHWVRDTVPKAVGLYPLIMHGLAFAMGTTVCAVSGADILLTLEVEGFAPEVGWAVGGLIIMGGDKFIDWVVDKRKNSPETFLKIIELLKGKANAPTE